MTKTSYWYNLRLTSEVSRICSCN